MNLFKDKSAGFLPYLLLSIILVDLILFCIPVLHFGVVGLAFSLISPIGLVIMAIILGIIGLNILSIIRFALFLIKQEFQSKPRDLLGFTLSIPIAIAVYLFVFDRNVQHFYIEKYAYYVALLNTVISMILLFLSIVIPRHMVKTLSPRSLIIEQEEKNQGSP